MALIVKGILEIKSGEIVALMGPNGSGKTSLALGIIGHKDYPIKGKISLDGENVSNLGMSGRAKKGLFLAWQNPVGINGVTVRQILKKNVEAEAKKLKIKPELLKRDINVNFSGGEKKRIQLLELMVLRPKYAILDEVDAGLDSEGLRLLRKIKTKKMGILLITHQVRVFDYLKPDRILEMKKLFARHPKFPGAHACQVPR